MPLTQVKAHVLPFAQPFKISPSEYELAVKDILDAAAVGLVDYESKHLSKLAATDGEYVIDIVARFTALGANFTVLIECKYEKRKVERQDVQILHSKLQSLGAQKAMLFSVSGFQSGAIEYARVHGIATIQLAEGVTMWGTRKAGPPSPPPDWVSIPKYVGWLIKGSSYSVLSGNQAKYTRVALGLEAEEP
jgi:restriction system protein